MKKHLLLLILLVSGYGAFAKQVSEQVARQVGFNFLKSKNVEGLTTAAALQLEYTSHSSTANYFYVFNRGSNAFVIVTADDDVIPILAYSTEGAFDANNIPDGAKVLFESYTKQMDIVFQKQATATDEIRGRWTALLEGKEKSGNKTTAVAPMVATKWNQNPYYNAYCPFDPVNMGTSVTGCVATAMAQMMKFWNYPNKGAGSHTYTHPVVGMQTADFGNTTYNWSNMPNTINSVNPDIATLMYHAGVSVEMDYSATGSGAQVAIPGWTTNPHSAQYALSTYFRYSASEMHAVYRQWLTTQDWIDTLKAELDAGRPLLYVGFGTVGGHVWIADGYDNNNLFHINWGWGGSSDAYYNVDDMNPPSLGTGGGSGGFYSNQHAILGIMPESPIPADKYEKNNNTATAYLLNLSYNGYNASANTAGSNIGFGDEDFYKIDLPAVKNYQYVIKATLHDKNKTTTSPNPFTVNAQFHHSSTGVIWSQPVEDVMADSIVVSANFASTYYFKVLPAKSGDTGTYRLDIDIKAKTTGIEDVHSAANVKIYPNPAKDVVYIDMADVKVQNINITDVQGRLQRTMAPTQKLASIPVNGLPAGMYFIQLMTDKEVVTRKITIE
jgi:hypothetical protein